MTISKERLDALGDKWAHAEHEKWLCEIEHEELLELIAAAHCCAELKARVSELRDKELNDISEINQLKTERDALRADNERLREALYAACNAHAPNWEGIEQLLETTPADSLREYRNGVLEEVDKRILTCCSVCSDGVVNGQDCPSCTVLRLTVRAM